MSILKPVLLGKWFHAHEDDTPGRSLYRPDTYALPRARGRSGFEFKADGTLILLAPGPTDRATSTIGKWSWQDSEHIKMEIPGRPDAVVEVRALESDRLETSP